MADIPGVVDKKDLQVKLRSIAADIKKLPKGSGVKYPAGNDMEQKLRQAGEEPAEAAGTGKGSDTNVEKGAAATEENKPYNAPAAGMEGRTPADTDVFSELENDMLWNPLEEYFELKPGLLCKTPKEQFMLNQVKPEDEGVIKRSWGNYWGLSFLFSAGKGVKAWIAVKRKKKIQKV